jgi:glutamyl-tRNA(Gln) amidotransferase subunit E
MNTPLIKTTLITEDYKKLGLKSGIEIHQQLEGKKLFCNCPTTIRDDKHDFEIKRYLRASAGESGTIDDAALAEMKKKKFNLYQGYEDSTCLVELDEEPPNSVNNEALQASLAAAKMFQMELVDQVRFMRKTVVDGSNTSGFQRTALIAVSGKLTTEEGLHVGVDTLCLEEDACKKIETRQDAEVYNLSRLGIPLIEVATSPDMKTPEEVKAVASHIGMVLRSLHNVKRGLGTIRQDVNVSIAAGVRVEIKGAQDLKLIPTIVMYEALRQYNLLQIFDELKKRKASVGEIVDVSSLFKTTEGKIIKTALAKKEGVVLALALYKYKGLTGLETQPGRRYGSELSDHAKVMGVSGLFHADELPKYGITEEEKKAVYKKLQLDTEKDNFLLIAAEKEIVMRALEAARKRASDFTLHKEVRNALAEGTSAYLRPMPGSSRMYPETDVKPLLIDKKNIVVPTLLTDKINELKTTFHLSDELAKRLVRDGVDLFTLSKNYPSVKPAFIIDMLYATPALIKKKHNLDIDMSNYLDTILEKLEKNEINKEAVPDIVVILAQGKEVNYKTYKALSTEELDTIIKSIIANNPTAPIGALMGLCMKEIGSKADGKMLMERLKIYVNKKK